MHRLLVTCLYSIVIRTYKSACVHSRDSVHVIRMCCKSVRVYLVRYKLSLNAFDFSISHFNTLLVEEKWWAIVSFIPKKHNIHKHMALNGVILQDKNNLESSDLASHCLHSLICFFLAGKNTLLFCGSSFYLFSSFIFVVLHVEHNNASSVLSGFIIKNYIDILCKYP